MRFISYLKKEGFLKDLEIEGYDVSHFPNQGLLTISYRRFFVAQIDETSDKIEVTVALKRAAIYERIRKLGHGYNSPSLEIRYILKKKKSRKERK